MVNLKNRNLILAAWAVIWLAAMGYFFYSRYQTNIVRKRELAAATVKAAAEKEKLATEESARLKEKLDEQSKRLATLRQTKGMGGVLTAEETDAPISGLLGERPAADQMNPIIPAAEGYINSHMLTATSIDKTPYAVIDAHRYRVGDQIILGPDMALRVSVIKDGYVIFTGEGYSFKMLLVLPK